LHQENIKMHSACPTKVHSAHWLATFFAGIESGCEAMKTRSTEAANRARSEARGAQQTAVSTLVWLIVISLGFGCDQSVAMRFERNAEARRMTATLQTQFAQTVEASNRLVLADTDQAAAEFAREADQGRERVEATAKALSALLRDLTYPEERKLLDEFQAKFAAYEVLDRKILTLAGEKTNLMATRLAFGPVMEQADTLQQTLSALADVVQGPDALRVRVLALETVGGVREIQALQAPHIAEADDAAMTRMEARMASAEAAARRAITELSSLVPVGAAPKREAASAALEHFSKLNAELVALSRRNTNVRSRSLTLGEKRTLIATCEESLHALSAALAQRVSRPTR
jgi:hypothetical protein